MANEPTDEDRRIADTILAGHEQVLMFGQDSGVLRDDIAAALAAERARTERSTVERCAEIALKQPWCAGGAVTCGPEIAAALRALESETK